MLRLSAFVLLSVLMIGHAVAGGKTVAGRFDYYVLSLDWSPSWCALGGTSRGAAECAAGQKRGFVLHGLWPQFEHGWPSYCDTTAPPPSPGIRETMAQIMGSPAAVAHQWDKHGRCAGLSAKAYFNTAQKAFERIRRPAILRQILRPVALPASVVKAAFLEVNPTLKPDMIRLSCKNGYFQEVRICLSKALTPRACGADLRRDCRKKVLFPPLR